MGSSYCMLLIFATAWLPAFTFASGARIRGLQHIVKTIKVDGGEIVDCINKHKQPAFTHPLLANHTIQTEPTMKASATGSKEWFKVAQSWHKYGRCPQGSIPVKRHQNSNHQPRKKYVPPQTQTLGPSYHQHAVIQTRTSAGTILGGSATLNVWNPTVSLNDFSLSQIWLTAGSGADFNTMEAGWHVYPSWNGDSKTRMFIYWTRDNYQSTGCYDIVNCTGFVQTDNEFLIGGALDHSSTYGGQQFELSLSIEKDTSTGNWWLYVNGNAIGYWPPSLFTSIANAADMVEWGGEVYDSTGRGGQHSSNQMGSGHFPNEGYRRSSYTRGIKYIDSSNSVIQPRNSEDFSKVTTVPSCYDLRMDNTGDELYLFFGGPGCA